MFAIAVGMIHSGYVAAINGRPAQSLDANRWIVDGKNSLPLEKDQWKLEMRRLFEMSLLCISMEILELARGVWATLPGSVNLMPLAPNNLCNKIEFKAKRKANKD